MPRAERAVVVTATKPAPSGAWCALVYLSWVKRAERRGMMRGAARMTVVVEKRTKDRRSRKTACRIGGEVGARVKVGWV